MPDDDMVLVRRDDLRAAVGYESPVKVNENGPDAWYARLLAAANGDPTTVEEQWRIVGANGDEDTAQSLEDGLKWARSFDTCYPDSAPHRVERRTVASLVGPWTTQETP